MTIVIGSGSGGVNTIFFSVGVKSSYEMFYTNIEILIEIKLTLVFICQRSKKNFKKMKKNIIRVIIIIISSS